MQKRLLILFFVCSYLISYSQRRGVAFHVDVTQDSVLVLDFSKAKFILDDQPEYSQTNYNDSSWIDVKTDTVSYQGIGWFRFVFSSEKLIKNIPCYLTLSQLGASEIYLNGNRIYTFGRIGTNANHETPFFLDKKVVTIMPNRKAETNVLAIRYSNNLYHEYTCYRKQPLKGIMASFSQTDIVEGEQNMLSILGALLSSFLFSLCFIHLLLFLFYKEQKTNLYYSLHIFSYGLIIILSILSEIISYTPITLFVKEYLLMLLIPFFITLNAFFYSIYYNNFFPKRFKLLVFLFTLYGILYILNLSTEFTKTFFIVCILVSVVECLRVIYLAIKKRIRGAKILGFGLFVFAALLLTIFIISILSNTTTLHIEGTWLSISIILLVLFSLVSIPISMSVYLAYHFSLVNKDLKLQIKNVEKLSAENIKQEIEKKKILEEQNTVLETQVKERTEEIVKQKELIEAKQKEIIDSIRYAKRIQDAMLPRIKIIENKIKRLKK
ncbi:MAG: hypothetical protein HUU48_06920 [Flavobacteriales bacterium]|nr:hypothetical protein [Flavobacteriales bacterium]